MGCFLQTAGAAAPAASQVATNSRRSGRCNNLNEVIAVGALEGPHQVASSFGISTPPHVLGHQKIDSLHSRRATTNMKTTCSGSLMIHTNIILSHRHAVKYSSGGDQQQSTHSPTKWCFRNSLHCQSHYHQCHQIAWHPGQQQQQQACGCQAHTLGNAGSSITGCGRRSLEESVVQSHHRAPPVVWAACVIHGGSSCTPSLSFRPSARPGCMLEKREVVPISNTAAAAATAPLTLGAHGFRSVPRAMPNQALGLCVTCLVNVAIVAGLQRRRWSSCRWRTAKPARHSQLDAVESVDNPTRARA